MQLLSALITGLIFGVGLILSGMTNPAKVISFLDLAGSWDPSLAFVMGGAISIGYVAFRFAGKRTAGLLGHPFNLPTIHIIDRRLVMGSLTFGVGWGIAGFCPGPALTSLTLGIKPMIFTAAMLAGMAIFEVLDHFTRRQSTAT